MIIEYVDGLDEGTARVQALYGKVSALHVSSWGNIVIIEYQEEVQSCESMQ